MPTFQFFIEDDRYSVPTLKIAEASSKADAKAMAVKLLRQTRHYLSVQAYIDDECVFAVGAPSRRKPEIEDDASGE